MNPNLVKAVSHVHSEWSYDAAWSLQALARAFSLSGYRVILGAEHTLGFDNARWSAYRRACAEASSDRALIVPGLEYSDATNTVHVLTWGDLPFFGEDPEIGELLQWVHEMNGVAVLAHPVQNGAWKHLDPAWMPLLLGTEVWNRKSDGWAPSPEAISLLERTDLVPFTGLDFHSARQFFPLAMRIKTSGPVSEGCVLDALRCRQCWPEAFGLPGLRFAQGPCGVAARVAEYTRRVLARRVRPWISQRENPIL